LLATISLGQKKQNVYFLKNNGAFVSLKDSADYIRVIQEPDSGTTYFNLLEYYANGPKKRVGTLSSYNPNLILEGSIASYYSNGRKKEIAVYARGKITGPHYYYYPNGQLKKSLVHVNPSKAEKDATPITKMVSFYDSTGVELVKEGTGDYHETEEGNNLYEEGRYLNGFKDGIWKGKYLSSSHAFEEKYEMGKFISGTAFLNNGSSQPYTELEVMPGFKGGIEKFLEYVGRNYRFPVEASERGISGRIVVSFIVEANGMISNINLVKDIGYGTGRAAIKVMEDSPKWIPGLQHGIPVRVSYTLPLVLKTNR
jgi:antitoxin component YwqK of YwqJK toxin-antitoxin module